ncbi:hypothetical protein [Hymenobacter sp. APR13]|uniref:hypothetical protein n=1 Tax=Hymenobacter sp. APR13 TaxID=1356852 RepID=UPI0004E03895|nr:hypothetical protein [Hymenobacter sp. APR13]AII50377.1 hypothetical protein N008_00055 [Hymenobacter sp. APR13]
METSAIIAYTSLLVSIVTVTITSLVTIASKYIDSQQKINEHKLLIRGTYINRKIQAAEDVIIENSMFIEMYSSTLQLYEDFKNTKKKNKFLESKATNTSDALAKLLIEKQNHSVLYFDFKDAVKDNDINNNLNNANRLINELNILIATYNTSEEKDFSEIDTKITEFKTHIISLMNYYRSINSFLRTKLTEYDIL